jgi:hypothetical protein
LKLFGKIENNKLLIRTLLDNAGMGCEVNGIVKMHVAMSHPSTVNEGNITLEIPTPTVHLLSNWQEI